MLVRKAKFPCRKVDSLLHFATTALFEYPGKERTLDERGVLLSFAEVDVESAHDQLES